MTIFFPDLSVYSKNYVVKAGTPVVMARATLSTSYTDPTYAGFEGQADHVGALFVAYHWMNHGNITGQVQHARSVVGDTPLMLDVEDLNGNTGYSGVITVEDIQNFIAIYRVAGGKLPLVYLPHWYWQDHMGSPNLSWMTDMQVGLVSSNYPSSGYSDSGPGWAPYGGIAPVQWQYTASPVDMNAYKGDLASYTALVGGGFHDGWNASTHPTIREGSTGQYVEEWQTDLTDVANKQGDTALNPGGIDGIFGPHTDRATRAYQWSRGLVNDGIVGPITWSCMHDRG
jgi:Glycosyl hydrolases family 25/Putative peptidoglycan binding domain